MASAIFLAGCVHLIASSDPETISAAEKLQTSVAGHFQALGGQTAPACFHDAHQAFYAQEQAYIAALEQRVRSLPKNNETIAQVTGLRGSLDSFEALHKRASSSNRCLSPAELAPPQSGINTSLTSILTLERKKPQARATP